MVASGHGSFVSTSESRVRRSWKPQASGLYELGEERVSLDL